MRPRRWSRLAIVGVTLGVSLACVRVWQVQFLPTPEAVPDPEGGDFLKCHLHDGGVVVLSEWQVMGQLRTIAGHGIRYDSDRRRGQIGGQSVSFDEVALFESTRPTELMLAGLPVLGVMAGLTGALAVLCHTGDDKTCFGSCPTFYVGDSPAGRPVAEGFSASVARALESDDLDALPAAGTSRHVRLWMTNEAPETHVVDRLRLLAVRRAPCTNPAASCDPAARPVLRTGTELLPARAVAAPRTCQSPTGDCTAAISASDGVEVYRAPSRDDLVEDETVTLTLPRLEGDLAIFVEARNSLLNTFLLYQALAYMGRDAGAHLAAFERDPGAFLEAWSGVGRLLGDIVIEVETADGFVVAGSFGEVGPIASDVQAVRVPAAVPAGDLRVRLRMRRGNWRIDQVGMASVAAPAEGRWLSPVSVRRRGVPDPAALALLTDRGGHLITGPGDAYELEFDLRDEAPDAALFLESRGYYYEWTREAWLRETDPASLRELLVNPQTALRRLAPEYARREPEMERLFFGSRFGIAP